MAANIDATIDLIKGHLTKTAAKHGAEMIGSWESELETADFRGAKTIHTDLAALRTHLEGDTLDGSAIGEMLVKLGGSTERAATHAEGDSGNKLESLGQALVKAGEKLSGDSK